MQGNYVFMEEGVRRYQEWEDHLLSTPESRARYEEIAAEQELWLQLVQARLEAGLTEVELAEKLGVSQAEVERIEECSYNADTLRALRRYVQALGKTLQISIV